MWGKTCTELPQQSRRAQFQGTEGSTHAFLEAANLCWITFCNSAREMLPRSRPPVLWSLLTSLPSASSALSSLFTLCLGWELDAMSSHLFVGCSQSRGQPR